MSGRSQDEDVTRDDVVRPDAIFGPGQGPGPSNAATPAVTWRELLRFLPDVVRLLGRLAKDNRVPWHAKLAAGGALAYLVSPIDLIPDFLPVGQVDDIYVAIKTLRHLFHSAGYDVVHDAWPGTDEGFAALLLVVGLER